ncbi:MAG: TonB-dependent receptor [Prevotellaceae bacterium]|nr:TonB-dependent receptor [Prevotellaceae bacterium]
MNSRKLQLVVLALVGCVTGYSQEKNQRENDSVAGKYDLQEIEVRATRVSGKMPIAHTDVSQEELKKKNFGQDIPYLLQNTPSVVITSDAGNGVGYTDIRLRGVDASRINVTTNGVPMNDAESHKMYWVDAPDLASAIGSVQIQRGAGSSTNGAGAFGGSINMNTASLSSRFEGEASFSYGMFNTNKQSLNLNSGLLDKHWVVNGRFSHIYSDGYIDRASTDLNSFLAQAAYYNGATVIKYLTFGGKERTYNAWDGMTKEQMDKGRRHNSCGEIQDAEGKVVGYYDDQIDNYLQWNNQLMFYHKFANRWSLSLVGHYTYGDGFYEQYKNNAKLAYYMLPVTEDLKRSNLVRRKAMNNDFYGFVGSANYLSSRFSLALGVAGNRYVGDHWGRVQELAKENSFDFPHEYYRNKTDKKDANAFAKATYELFRNFCLYGDIQYRYIRHEIWGSSSSYDYTNEQMQAIDVDKTYDFVNPKAGVNYTFAKYNKVYFSFAVAQREPTRDDFTNASLDENGNRKYPKSEKMFDYEFGYQFDNKTWNVGVNLYYMDYDNQLVLTGQENMDTYDALYENVKDSYRRGVELSLGVNPLSWLSLGGNVTLSQNRIEDYTEYVYNDDTYAMDPEYLGTTTISYSPDVIAGLLVNFHFKGFEAAINSRYVSDQYITNAERDDMKLDSYMVSSLQLGYTLKVDNARNIRFGLMVNNLFNEKYCSHAYGYSGIYGGQRVDEVFYFPQATTNVLANVTYTF